MSFAQKLNLNKVQFLKRHSPCSCGAYSQVENADINKVTMEIKAKKQSEEACHVEWESV